MIHNTCTFVISKAGKTKRKLKERKRGVCGNIEKKRERETVPKVEISLKAVPLP